MGALSQCAGQAELCINAFANWMRPFFNDGWSERESRREEGTAGDRAKEEGKLGGQVGQR